MNWIKLDATPSTNAYLKNLLEAVPLTEDTLVTTSAQTQGRGQLGTSWVSEKGKNLTMSYLHFPNGVEVRRQFEINMAIALGAIEVLEGLGIPDLSVKWPNDILSSSYKIGGILIENQLKGRFISSTVIGLGLNVLQHDFPDLPFARSLVQCKAQEYDLETLAQSIVKAWEAGLKPLSSLPSQGALHRKYEEALFGRDGWKSYQTDKGRTFEAQVQGIHPDGRIRLLESNGQTSSFALKEIKLLRRN